MLTKFKKFCRLLFTNVGNEVVSNNNIKKTLVQRGQQFIADLFVFTGTFLIYNLNMSKVYFVTGISGAGKSTLVKELRSILTSEKFKVHDFDEIRVPHNPNKSWRIDTTNYWLKITHEYTRSDKNILPCGQFMPSEVERAPSYSKPLNIKWGFLKIDNETIETRLTTYRK